MTQKSNNHVHLATHTEKVEYAIKVAQTMNAVLRESLLLHHINHQMLTEQMSTLKAATRVLLTEQMPSHGVGDYLRGSFVREITISQETGILYRLSSGMYVSQSELRPEELSLTKELIARLDIYGAYYNG